VIGGEGPFAARCIKVSYSKLAARRLRSCWVVNVPNRPFETLRAVPLNRKKISVQHLHDYYANVESKTE